MRRSTIVQLAIALGCTAGVAVTLPAAATAAPPAGKVRPASSSPSVTGALVVERQSGPDRSVVRDGSGSVVATFTDGSRSVALAGPARTFAEPSTTSATVHSTTWVRLLPEPFDGTVDLAWLDRARQDTTPDVLATALAFTTGAEQDASYGPLVDGARQEGSDWNDYYGVDAAYDGVVDRPEADQLGAVDCSGFVRLVVGHLGGVPMVVRPDGVRLPRRAVQMAESAPGVLVVPNTGSRPEDLGRLLPGDLVLFDASTDDGTAVDHVGFYLGVDSKGSHRFVSSRKSSDGPTMGDVRGASRLDGKGLYATSLRAVRRL